MHRDSPSGSQIRRGRARSNGESAAHRVGALGGAEAAGVGASVEQWRWPELGAAATGARGRAKVAGRLAGFLGVPRYGVMLGRELRRQRPRRQSKAAAMSVGNGGASSNSNQSRERTEGERGAAHIDDGELLGEARGAVELPESSTAMAVEVEEGDDGAGIDEVVE